MFYGVIKLYIPNAVHITETSKSFLTDHSWFLLIVQLPSKYLIL